MKIKTLEDRLIDLAMALVTHRENGWEVDIKQAAVARGLVVEMKDGE